MTMNEFEKLKAGDNIYYVAENGNDFFVGDSKVEEKKVINGYRMLSFYPDKRVESETSLFLYGYDWEGLVVKFYYENVFLTKKEAEEVAEKFQEKIKTTELTEELPWY